MRKTIPTRADIAPPMPRCIATISAVPTRRDAADGSSSVAGTSTHSSATVPTAIARVAHARRASHALSPRLSGGELLEGRYVSR